MRSIKAQQGVLNEGINAGRYTVGDADNFSNFTLRADLEISGAARFNVTNDFVVGANIWIFSWN